MPLLTELSIRDMLWYWALRFSSFGVRAGIAPFRSGMSIAPGSNTHRPSSTRSGMGCGAGRLPSATSQSSGSKTHAAPTELMVSRRPACYKHAAPDGAWAIQQLLVGLAWSGAGQPRARLGITRRLQRQRIPPPNRPRRGAAGSGTGTHSTAWLRPKASIA